MATGLENYVPLREAARLTGLSERTITRRAAEGSIRFYVGPDRRYRLVPVEDLATLTDPKPITPRAEEVDPLPAA